jgi:CO/xanthine dehydrogenase FAD-binding subunit
MPALYNLREYHRPSDLDEAIHLLQRKKIKTVALAGGVSTIGESPPDIEAVVDLSNLGLDFIEQEDNTLLLGAMVRIQTLVERLGDIAGGLLAETAERMAGANIRNAATLGGSLAGGDIHAPLSVALAAMKARVKIYGQAGEMPLWADLASEVRTRGLRGRLITTITLKLPNGTVGAAYEQVARTPADHPIVCAACFAYTTGNESIEANTTIGGLLSNRLITITQTVAHSNLTHATETLAGQVIPDRTPETAYLADFLGSAAYRRSIAPVLAQRALTSALGKIGLSS